MRRFDLALLAAAVVLGSVSVASAADLPRKAPVAAPVEAPFTWTGFYGGINGGYGWGTANWSGLSAPAGDIPGEFAQHDTKGGFGGVLWGYDRQFGQWVIGFASDFDWGSIKGSSTCFGNPGDFSATCGTKTTFITTSTARVGWAMGQFLPYVKGGWALEYLKLNAAMCCGEADYQTTKAWRSGWTAGGGLEYALDRRWSVFVEYDYMNFGNNTEGFTPTVQSEITTNFSANIKNTVSVVKGGVNLRWGDWLFR